MIIFNYLDGDSFNLTEIKEASSFMFVQKRLEKNGMKFEMKVMQSSPHTSFGIIFNAFSKRSEAKNSSYKFIGTLTNVSQSKKSKKSKKLQCAAFV